MTIAAHVDFVSTSCGQLLCGLHLRQQKSDAWDLESASTSTLQNCGIVISYQLGCLVAMHMHVDL